MATNISRKLSGTRIIYRTNQIVRHLHLRQTHVFLSTSPSPVTQRFSCYKWTSRYFSSNGFSREHPFSKSKDIINKSLVSTTSPNESQMIQREKSGQLLPVDESKSWFEIFREKCGWEITRYESKEVGQPATPGSPYYMTSLKMPTIYEVEAAVQGLQKEARKMRLTSNLVLLGMVVVIILLSMREADSFLWRIITKFATTYLPPETAHTMVMTAAKLNKLPLDTRIDDPQLRITICGIPFPNPVGLAAGFDKSCDQPLSFLKMGYGFVEVGTVTPFPQDGNKQPRMFRLPKDQAVINRCGFNKSQVLKRSNIFFSSGIETFVQRLKTFSQIRWNYDLCRLGAIGVNLGKNKDSNDPVWDYVEATKRVAPYADYLVLNVSSPNTPGLRKLQKKSKLYKIITAVQNVLSVMMDDVEKQKKEMLKELREEKGEEPVEDEFRFGLPTLTGKKPALFVKISPDISNEEMDEIAEVILKTKTDGMIISNTTITRPDTLETEDKDLINEAGGLSGKPLKDISTEVVKQMYRKTNGTVPIIAVGGVFTGADALDKIEAGASAVQLYTAMVYEGPGISRRIKKELSVRMYRKGYRSIHEAIGAYHKNQLVILEDDNDCRPFWKRKAKKIKAPKFDY